MGHEEGNLIREAQEESKTRLQNKSGNAKHDKLKWDAKCYISSGRTGWRHTLLELITDREYGSCIIHCIIQSFSSIFKFTD